MAQQPFQGGKPQFSVIPHISLVYFYSSIVQ